MSSVNKQNLERNFFNVYKPPVQNKYPSSFNHTQNTEPSYKPHNNSYFPDTFNINNFANNQINSKARTPGVLDANERLQRKSMTKDEMKMLLMEHKFSKLQEQNEEDKKVLLRFINNGINVPVNTMLQYQNAREQEQIERRDIDNRRENTKKELQRAQEQLKRELEFSDDDEDDDYKTKINKLDKKLKKQVAKYQPNGLKDYNFEKPLTNAYERSKIEPDDIINYNLMNKNPEVVNAEKDLKYMDVDYQMKISALRKNDKRATAFMMMDYNQRMSDIMRVLDRYEQKNLMAIEHLRTVFEKSGSKRLKYLSKKVLGGEDVVEEEADQPLREFDDKKLLYAHDEDVDYILNKKKQKFPDFVDAVNKKENDMDLNEWKKKRKDKLKDQIIKRQMELNNSIEKRLAISNYKDFVLQPKNKLRVYIHFYKAAQRIINIKLNSNIYYRLELLKIFVSYYESVNPVLEKWIFSSIRTVYLNIYNFDNLDFKLENLNDSRTKEHTYIAIETRIKGILEGIMNNSTIETVETNILKLFGIVSTKGSFVPLKFYYNFEISRFKSVNNELLSISEPQRDMILSFYIFLKVICKSIMVDHKFSNGLVKSDSISQNFKTIVSIFYWTLIKYYRYYNNVIRETGPSIEAFTDFRSHEETGKKRVFYKNFDLKTVIEKKYKKICIDYEKRNIGFVSSDEKDIMAQIEKCLPTHKPDNLRDEVSSLKNSIYQEDQLTKFFEIAEAKGFNILKAINKITDKLKTMIPEIDIKDEI